ncbi:MAG: hypothetical protein ABIA75_14845 [Candidatus Neomarinimicrobiota bacterium]
MLKIETKSAIIIFVTFFLGLGLGMTSSQYLIGKRIDKLSNVRNRPGFENVIKSTIIPSDEQLDTLNVILYKHSTEMQQMREQQISQTIQLFEKLLEELKPILTEEQLRRLDRMSGERLKGRFPFEGRPPGMHEKPREPRNRESI